MSERAKAFTEAAEFAEFYAEERLRLAGDSVLHDPILRGGEWTPSNLAKSRDATIEGWVNSAAYHAATNIAEHFRNLAAEALK